MFTKPLSSKEAETTHSPPLFLSLSSSAFFHAQISIIIIIFLPWIHYEDYK